MIAAPVRLAAAIILGEARLTTWLTRIILNDALGRLRQRRPVVDLKSVDAINEQGGARVILLPNAR